MQVQAEQTEFDPSGSQEQERRAQQAAIEASSSSGSSKSSAAPSSVGLAAPSTAAQAAEEGGELGSTVSCTNSAVGIGTGGSSGHGAREGVGSSEGAGPEASPGGPFDKDASVALPPGRHSIRSSLDVSGEQQGAQEAGEAGASAQQSPVSVAASSAILLGAVIGVLEVRLRSRSLHVRVLAPAPVPAGRGRRRPPTTPQCCPTGHQVDARQHERIVHASAAAVPAYLPEGERQQRCRGACRGASRLLSLPWA